MPRTALPPSEVKVLFNCYLHNDVLTLMKIICFRHSVRAGKKYSEGKFVTDAVLGAKVPKAPTAEQVRAYIAKYPKQADELRKLASIPIRKIRPKPTD